MLFEPLTIRGLTIRNRIWMSPMCQYNVLDRDGIPTAWHLVHYGARAAGGFGLIMVEATAVRPEGRISVQDLGLWSDTQLDQFVQIVDFCHEYGAAVGVQRAHAGRKGSSWPDQPIPSRGLQPISEGGFTPVGPTAQPFPGLAVPQELSSEQVAAIPEAFVEAALRAEAVGFDVVEIHAAHGYLLHEFYSPITNQRDDIYGGDFYARTRLTREVAAAVRGVWPQDKPVFARLSATEWVDDGWSADDTVRLSLILKELGIDLLDVSSGGNFPTKIPTGPGYQVRFADRVRREAGILTSAVGLITEPTQAEQILRSGQADAVMLGRAALREPAWPERAAAALGHPNPMAGPYRRGSRTGG
jgi:2,4-dienoyl-CoA reductase-like NADH-dependent reductase (Old Yellow Enzyme family)